MFETFGETERGTETASAPRKESLLANKDTPVPQEMARVQVLCQGPRTNT